MTTSQSQWPRHWLMTDQRIGEQLWEAIDHLPRGSGGIVFRHHGLGSEDRLALGKRIAKAAAERELKLAVSGSLSLANELGAMLIHNPVDPGDLPLSVSVHDEGDAARARRLGASLAFISPVHDTRSHPGAPSLGSDRAASLARLIDCPAIALGGMNAARFDALEKALPGLFYGFAGIDCWLAG